MNYIDAEIFLKQPKEVQKTLMDWWKPEMYDLFFRNFTNANGYLKGIYKGCIQDYELEENVTKNSTFLPLLTETQLRKFIEDKLDGKINCTYYNLPGIKGYEGYGIEIYNTQINSNKGFKDLGDDLLEAYWKVACEITQEGNI